MRRQWDRLRDKERPLPVSLPLALPASELQSAETVQDGGGGDSSAPGMPLDLFICLPWARSLYVTQTNLQFSGLTFPVFPGLHHHATLGTSFVTFTTA